MERNAVKRDFNIFNIFLMIQKIILAKYINSFIHKPVAGSIFLGAKRILEGADF
jgi:hypothetical protein